MSLNPPASWRGIGRAYSGNMKGMNMNGLIAMLAKNAMGSLWTTSLGGVGVWKLAEPVVHMFAQGKPLGEILFSGEFIGLATSIMAIISPDPNKGR